MKSTNHKIKIPINVAIIESDPLRVAGFLALLESEKDMCLESMSPSELGGVAKIDVAILGKGNGQGLPAMMQYIKTLHPNTRVIVTSLGGNDATVLNALANGVKGYVDEAASAEEFVNAIRAVNQGLVWASRRVLAMFVDRCSVGRNGATMGSREFTKREREVLEMLVAGRSNREIAAPLGIEERTVKAHVAKLMRKVGVQNRIMLSVHAIKHCLVAQR